MGQAAIFRMAEDFYVELEKSPIRDLFPDDMVAAAHRNAAFLVGVLGGPPLYRELYGSPQMRARHLSISIDRAARDVWLSCFLKVLEGAEVQYGFPPEHLPGFRQWLAEFSMWMVNRAPR
jgi:hemoglobin